MYHYLVINDLTHEVVLSSQNRQDFDGYISNGKAYTAGLQSKIDNSLSDFHSIHVIVPLKWS